MICQHSVAGANALGSSQFLHLLTETTFFTLGQNSVGLPSAAPRSPLGATGPSTTYTLTPTVEHLGASQCALPGCIVICGQLRGKNSTII